MVVRSAVEQSVWAEAVRVFNRLGLLAVAVAALGAHVPGAAGDGPRAARASALQPRASLHARARSGCRARLRARARARLHARASVGTSARSYAIRAK